MKRFVIVSVSSIFLSLTLAWAGGLVLSFGNPSSAVDQKAQGGVLLVQVAGCAQPAEVTVKATGEGSLAGKRVSYPLEAVRLNSDTVVLKGRLPESGPRIVHVEASWRGATSSSLVRVDADGRIERGAVQRKYGRYSASEVTSALAPAALASNAR